MRHEMLTQRTFLPSRAMQKGYAESAFCDACRTSSDSRLLVGDVLTTSQTRGGFEESLFTFWMSRSKVCGC